MSPVHARLTLPISPIKLLSLVFASTAAVLLAACGGSGDTKDADLQRFEPLASITEQFDDLLAVGLDDDYATGFRGLSGFYLDADGETQSWRILSGELFRLAVLLDRITIVSASEGGGRIEFGLTDATVFSPDPEAITDGRCTLVLTDGRRNAAAVADIEDTNPSWCR